MAELGTEALVFMCPSHVVFAPSPHLIAYLAAIVENLWGESHRSPEDRPQNL